MRRQRLQGNGSETVIFSEWRLKSPESEVRDVRGVAKNNPANLEYLQACEAVESLAESGELIDFKFDPKKQPTDGVPDTVFFDLSASPF